MLSEKQKRLLSAMTTTRAHISCGSVWTGTEPSRVRHHIRDLYALRAAALVRPAESIASNWSSKYWQISEKGHAAASHLIEQQAAIDSQSSATHHSTSAGSTTG